VRRVGSGVLPQTTEDEREDVERLVERGIELGPFAYRRESLGGLPSDQSPSTSAPARQEPARHDRLRKASGKSKCESAARQNVRRRGEDPSSSRLLPPSDAVPRWDVTRCPTLLQLHLEVNDTCRLRHLDAVLIERHDVRRVVLRHQIFNAAGGVVRHDRGHLERAHAVW
jgi:hypothetical protein